MDTKALRQKILDLAIRGKLVPQEPNDEPAEVLLERIREQKQQMFKEGKLKKKDIKNDTIIFKGEDNLHYEKFQDGTVKCIEDEIPFEVPEGWCWVRVRDIAMVKGGKRLPKGASFSEEITTHAYIRVTDMKNHSVNISNLRYISDEIFSAIKNYTIAKDDLYVTIAGTIGVVGEIPDKLDGMNLTENAVKITNIAINKSFLCIILQTDFVQQQFQNKTHQVAMPKLALERILSTLIPICPYVQQLQIVDRFQICDNFLSTIDTEKEELQKIVSLSKYKILDLAIRGKLVPQDPNDEPASVILERIRTEKEELIKQGKIKRDKKESVIFKGDDNSYYEKIDGEVSCIDEEIPYNIPDTWTWVRLENCCVKEIRRGKSPKYAEISNVIVFAQKCNTKYNGIDISLAQYLDETTIKRYPTDEHMQDGDIVINSTGTGTLGRVGIYRNTDNTTGLLIVPDSHVTVIRSFSCISSYYLYAFMKAHQTELEKKGEGSTNQKELKPLTLKEMLIAVPPISEQKRINKSINVAFSHLAIIEKCLN